MYSSEWWKQYEQWAEETRPIRADVLNLIEHYVNEVALDGTPSVVIDLGCGGLGQGAFLFQDFGLYIGVDKSIDHSQHPGYFFDAEDFQSYAEGNRKPANLCFDEDDSEMYIEDDFDSVPFWTIVQNCKAWGHSTDPGQVAVVSLFAVEMFHPDPDSLYREAFESEVDIIVVSGAYYGHTDPNLPNEEPEATIRQTPPGPVHAPNALWDEIRIVKAVPSNMFGPDVVEVWRVMTRKVTRHQAIKRGVVRW